MINIYLYSDNTAFIKETELGYVTTYLKHKNNIDTSKLGPDDLNFIIDRVFPFVCFEDTRIGNEVILYYYHDIVKRQKEDNSRNFVIRACAVEPIIYAINDVKRKFIESSFFKISINEVDVSFDDNNYLVSDNETIQEFLNWCNS